MSDSGQKFIKRNRPPRVQISYEDPYNAEKQVELPFVMGILADLSGNASKVAKPTMAERKFSNVDMDNFEDYMASVEPAATFRVANKLGGEGGEQLGVNLTFKRMEDFTPGAIARQVPALRALLEAREQLANLQRYMDGKVAAEDQLKKLLADPQLMQALKERREAAIAAKPADESPKKATHRSPSQGKLTKAEAKTVATELTPDKAATGGVVIQEAEDFSGIAETELQAAQRARGDGSRERRQHAGPAGAGRYEPDQGRRARHDRRDDRAARRKALRPGQRDPAQRDVPADRERLARPALHRLQFRDRRDRSS